MTGNSQAANQGAELPPYANAIYASICIASRVVTDRSAGDGTRAEHDTGPCDAAGRITHVCAVDDGAGRLWGCGDEAGCQQRSGS
jgi:predicted ATPase